MKFAYSIITTLLVVMVLWLTDIPALNQSVTGSATMVCTGGNEAQSTAANDMRTSSFPTPSVQSPDKGHTACALDSNSQHQAFSNFLTHWQESQQRFIQHQQEWLRTYMARHRYYHRQQADCLLSLSPRPHPFGSGKPCKSYYVFAMRHIVI